MKQIYLCERCLQACKPKVVNGVGILKTFHGYTVDVRLQQLRRVTCGEDVVYIAFESDEGLAILLKLHESIVH